MKAADKWNWAGVTAAIMFICLAVNTFSLRLIGADKFSSPFVMIAFNFWAGVFCLTSLGIFSAVRKRVDPIFGALIGVALFSVVVWVFMVFFFALVFAASAITISERTDRILFQFLGFLLFVASPLISFAWALLRQPKEKILAPGVQPLSCVCDRHEGGVKNRRRKLIKIALATTLTVASGVVFWNADPAIHWQKLEDVFSRHFCRSDSGTADDREWIPAWVLLHPRRNYLEWHQPPTVGGFPSMDIGFHDVRSNCHIVVSAHLFASYVRGVTIVYEPKGKGMALQDRQFIQGAFPRLPVRLIEKAAQPCDTLNP